jgi:class 3 adenylate cyclase/tetratricopeptide (TPR) repeat protein
MMMAPRSLQFASFTLDLDRLCLLGPSGRAELRPKSFEVLRYLVEHAGRVVGKEAVIEAVWPDVTVTDESLTRCISEIRHAIGDESQRIIQTVPKRGYLLDVPISVGDVTPAPAPADKLVPSAVREPEAEPVDRDVRVGERKHVTVLCADLKQSLERVAERDPEEALKIFEAVLPLMTQAVHQYEGTVNFVTGDGIMALFGAPLAYEDHAVRACYAALQIQEAVGRYAQGLQQAAEVPILIRAGLNSGEVVIRTIANGARTECHAMGQAIHLADRLAQIAAPGTCLIGAETRRLAEGHVEVAALEPITGERDPVYELVGARPAETRFQALAARGLTRFVGREAEIEQLERVRAKAEQQHGQVVAIIGEPGLGKSRLVHEFIHPYRTSPWLALEAASVSYRRASYEPVIDLLRSYFKIEARDDVGEMRNKVAGRLLDLDRELAPDLPPLLTLLDIPVEESSWQSLEPSQRRQRTFDALKRLILRECQQQPVILAVEDLHWIDSETQAFLETVIDSLAFARLLLILTYRPEYEHRWGGKTYYTQLNLDALSSEAIEEFLRNLLGDDASLIGLKEQLPSDGNPFFLEESIRALVDTNVLQGRRGAYRLISPMPELRTPPSVQAILAARIDHLPPRERRLLHAASVVGKDVPYAILQPIAGLAEDDLRRGLAKLREAEFLYESRLLPDIEYTFKHALTHDVAYGSLLAEQRSALHRQIVDVIERLYPDRLIEYVEQLAHHALRGELREKAVHYLRQSGLKSAARSALRDAQSWFEQALDVLSLLPESHSTLEQAVDIRFELRAVLNQLGQPRRVLERLLEAEALAERLNDNRRRSQARVLAMHIRSMLGELDEACATGTHELAVAQTLDDFYLSVLIATVEMAHYFHSDYLRVVELAAELEAALPGARSFDNIRTWSESNLSAWLIMSLAELGRFSEAATHEIEAIRFAESTRHAFSIGLAHRAAVTLHLLKGEWTRARSLIEHWIEVARAGNVVLQFPTAIASFAWVTAQLGAASEALDAVREGERLIERQATSGVVVNRGSVYHAIGRASLLLGRLDEAHRLADRAVESASSQLGFAAHALHLLGDIATHHDQFDAEAGGSYYRRALALAEPRGMRPLVAHCHRGLGELYRSAGKERKAEKRLATATSMYRDMEMRFWLETAGERVKV